MFGRIFTTLFLMSTLISVNAAFAQGYVPNPPDYVPSARNFVPYPYNERPRPTPFQQAKEKWEKLSESETSCINDALRWENTSIKNLMQKGIAPTDPKLTKIRSNCQTQMDATASAAASDAETKKQIAELNDQLRMAQTEIQRLRAETERLKSEAIERMRPQSQKGKLDTAKLVAQNNSSNSFIYTLIGVVTLILGILFLIGLFAPKAETKEISQ